MHLHRFALFILISITAAAQDLPPREQTIEEPAGRTILVKPRRGAPDRDIDRFHAGRGGRKVHGFRSIPWQVVHLPNERAQARRALVEYHGSPLFEAVQWNVTYQTTAVPGDPRYSEQWAPAKIQAPAAWDLITEATNIVLGVIDTGIDPTHPDLMANLWRGPNGEHGYQAVGGVVGVSDGDGHGHGTHVAGIMGAVANNGIGVAGLNWKVKIIDLKFMGANGSGYTSDAVLIIDKAIELKRSGVNLVACNNSWIAFGLYDLALEDAFKAAEEAGIFMVCAAGNNGRNIDDVDASPATLNVDSIISVMASDQNDVRATFSNYGVANTDLAAPGVSILSTLPNTNYQAWSGTSMAAPHVTGAAGMLYALAPSLSPVVARQVFLNPGSYDQILTGGIADSSTSGRLNLYKLVTNPEKFSILTNSKPVLEVFGPTNAILSAGESATWTALATDADNDPVIYRLTSTADVRDHWVVESMLGWRYKYDGLTNRAVVAPFSQAMDTALRLKFTASDGRGGSDAEWRDLFIRRDESKVRDLSRAWVSWHMWTNDLGYFSYEAKVDTNMVDPLKVKFSIMFTVGANAAGNCCFVPNFGPGLLYYDNRLPGIYRSRAQLVDEFGNFAESPSAMVIVGTNQFVPETRWTNSPLRGPVPLDVTIDLSSSATQGRSTWFWATEWWKPASGQDPENPVKTFRFETPGTRFIELFAWDKVSGGRDSRVITVTALPVTVTNAPAIPPTPPSAPTVVLR